MEVSNRIEYPSITTIESPSNISECDNSSVAPKRRFPIRILIAVLGVSTCLVMSSTRYNLPVAMISMVHDSCAPNTSICGDQSFFLESSETPDLNDTSKIFFSTFSSPLKYYSPRDAKECNANDQSKKHLLRWGEVLQGIALGVYYHGFTVTSIFGGRLSEQSKNYFGPKMMVTFGLIGSALFNAILPPLAKLSFGAFVVVR